MSHPIEDWRRLPRSLDPGEFDVQAGGPCAELAPWQAIMPLLVSPETHQPLRSGDGHLVDDVGATFPFIDGRPVLLPQRALSWLDGDAIAVPDQAAMSSAFDQYLYLHQVKNAGGQPNTPLSDPWYRRHLHRSAQLLSDARGLVLDVGCDDPNLSRRLFPPTAQYLGLEPAIGRAPGLRLIGMAEFLPLADASVDGLAFLTSLDHILDYAAAMEEAFRVLKPGGALYLATLIWVSGAGLHKDDIHFHHFRDFEIQGVLRPFHIESATAYDWKHDPNRFGLYLRARKPSIGAG